VKIAVPMVLCLLLFSCAIRQEVTKEPLRRPEKEHQPLVERIGEYNNKLTSINATAIVVFRDIDNTLSLRCEVLARDGAELLRLEFKDFVFKKPLATVVRNYGTVATYVHPTKECYQTAVEKTDFGSLLGFSIPVKLLFSSILARVYIPEGEVVVEQIDDNNLLIEALQEQEVVRFGQAALPEEIAYAMTDSLGHTHMYRVSFETFEEKGSLVFPLVIKVTGQDRILEIRYSSVEPNAAISEEQFITGSSDLEGCTRSN
jgi:outer membrane biogenesis lipoprotein LolB